MAVYFFMLSMPALLGLAANRRVGWLSLLPVFLIFVFLVGFRYHVGMDWSNYEAIHRFIDRSTPAEILYGSEPLSNIIFWFSKQYSDGTLITNVAAAAILLFGVFSLARRTADPWIALIAATPYLIIVIGMSGIRQGMAAGVFFFALSQWYQVGTVWRLGLVFLASLFHASALLLTIFPMAEMKGGKAARIALGGLAAVLGVYFGARSGLYGANFEFYENSYFSEVGKVDSPGALFHIVLVVFPAALFLAYRNSLFASIQENRVLLYASIASVALIPSIPISSTGASRFSIYLQFVPMVIYPALTKAFGAGNRTLVRLLIILAHFVVLFVWLNMANNSLAYRQYDNILF